MILPRYAMLTLAGLLSSACVVAPSQQVAGPQTMRVRVTADKTCYPERPCSTLPLPQAHQGPLIFVDSDTLSMHSRHRESQVALPVWSIRKLEVYRGQKTSAGSTAKGAGIGAVAGAALGGLAGLVMQGLRRMG